MSYVIKLYYHESVSFEVIDYLTTSLNCLELVQFNDVNLLSLSNCLVLSEAEDLTLYLDGFNPFKLNVFYSDFIKLRYSILSKELLLSSINYTKLKNLDNLAVLDLTGGLGRDAIIFALAGFQVTIIESNPILVLILRYLKHKFASLLGDIVIVYANNLEFLINSTKQFSFIYYDPMFEDGKHALAKKDMQIIDVLIKRYPEFIYPSEVYELLKSALAKCHKFIVKRDNKQHTLLSHLKPTYQKFGKTIRFDIYQGTLKLTNE